jgi:hypothetical protein
MELQMSLAAAVAQVKLAILTAMVMAVTATFQQSLAQVMQVQ